MHNPKCSEHGFTVVAIIHGKENAKNTPHFGVTALNNTPTFSLNAGRGRLPAAGSMLLRAQSTLSILPLLPMRLHMFVVSRECVFLAYLEMPRREQSLLLSLCIKDHCTPQIVFFNLTKSHISKTKMCVSTLCAIASP